MNLGKHSCFGAVPALLFCFGAPAIFAAQVCNVRQYGAPDAQSKSTAAIQKAIDDCAAKGGGTVVLDGAAKYVTAPITLRSGITLQVPKGTTLEGSTDHDDYPEAEQFRDHGRVALISASNAENIVITGGGVIDGRGESWWPHREEDYLRPRLVVFDHCKHVRMEHITVQNSAMWQITPYYSDDLIFRDIRVLAPTTSHNTDGIDPFSSTNVVIDHAFIDTGDDNVAIKSGQPGSAGPDAPSRHIRITDCTFLHGHGLSIGSEIAGGVQDVVAERIQFKGTGTGVRIKSNRDRGNDIGGFVYRDLKMEDVGTPILISEFYPKIPQTIIPEPVGRLTPHFHDITIENLVATGAKQAMVIVGLPESPIRDLKLRNVHIQAQRGAQVSYADVTATDITVQPQQGQPFTLGEGVTGTLAKVDLK